MQITQKADYALRAVLFLAQRNETTPVATNIIARAQRIPLTFLTKIIPELAAAGIVRATRGARGGVYLSRPAHEISMLNVLEAIDGPLVLNPCVHDPAACSMSPNCALHSVWCDAYNELSGRLERTKFSELAKVTRPFNQPSASTMPTVILLPAPEIALELEPALA